MASTKFDAIIVGGGIAGLTSAATLARAGKKILLLEKNHETGGLVNSFQRDGYVFDAGVRALIDAGIILSMLKNLGIQLDFVPSKVSVGIEDQMIHIDDLNSVSDYKALLTRLYPESKDEIDAFIVSMRKIMRLLDVLYGVENPIFKDIKKDKEYFLKTLLPWLPKFLLTIGKINRLSKPCEDYLKGMIKNPSLVDIISQHFFKATPTFFALSYFTLYLSYLYPKGGIGMLTDALVQKTKEFGGEILTNTLVKEVDADQKFVVDDQNNKHYYKDLIWAADLTKFYDITNLGNLKPGIKSDFQSAKAKITQGRPGESVFSLYLEVGLPNSYFKDISHGHFFYTPSKKGLGSIHRSDLAAILEKWENLEKETVYSWLDTFLKYNTFEISIPALRDPSLAPSGKTGVMVSILVEYELFAKLKSSGWSDEFINELENRIIQILADTIYPGLKDNVEKQFSFTPLSIEERIGSSGGAIVGWSFEAPIPVVRKMQDVNKSIITPIPNIYQAGQWAYSPAGVPMCILTGKLAADKIMK
jgi:phytoene dehydrogenase-like protein